MLLFCAAHVVAQDSSTTLISATIDSTELLGLDTTEILFEDSMVVEEHFNGPLAPSTVERDYVEEEGHAHGADLDSLEEHDNHSVSDSLDVVLDSIRLHQFVTRVLADSNYWIGIDSSFAIFDSMTVNPYKIDGAKFNDTVPILLYDTLVVDSGIHWSMPLIGTHYVTSKFGMRGYRWHYGTDLRLAIGDTVKSCFDGVVRIAKYNPGGYGNYVLIRHHNGLETLYGHLTKSTVRVGEIVQAGQLIGLGGNTGRSSGPHLHFEVRYEGNAFDTQYLYDFSSDTIRGAVFILSPIHFKYIKEQRMAVYHRIRSGDTLSGLASRYHVSINQICRLNGISRRTILRIGRRLRIR